MMLIAALLIPALFAPQQQPAKPKPLSDGELAIGRSWLDAIAISKDGTTLALMESATNNVVLYDARTFKELRTLKGLRSGSGSQVGGGNRTVGLAFSPDSKMVLAFKTDPMFSVFPVWDVASGKLVGKLPAYSFQTDAVGWNPTGKEIVATGGDRSSGTSDLRLKFWSTDLVNGQMSGEPKRSLKIMFSQEDIALDPTGTKIFLNVSEKGFVVCDAVTGKPQETVETKQGPFHSGYKYELSPNGKLLAVATGTFGKAGTVVQGEKANSGLLRIWDLERKAVVLDALQPDTAMYTAFSLDGKYVAASGLGALSIYEVESGKQLRTQPGGPCSFAFTPDGEWILIPTLSGLRAWKVNKP